MTGIGCRGTVHFSSTDTLATLPADYTFTSADAGVHSFNVTLKTVVGTGPMRDLTVKDTGTGISATQNIFVWWQVTLDVEFWKNCGFQSCPSAGSYFCQTAYQMPGYSQPTGFIAITQSSKITLFNAAVTVRSGTNRQVVFVGDAGPVMNNPYWDTGSPPAIAGCVRDLL